MQKAIIYICLAPAKLPVHSLKYCSFLLSAPKIKTVRSPLNLLFPGNLRSFVKSKKKSWRNGSFNLLARQWTWMISINSLSMVCVVYWSVWWLSSSFLVNGLWGGYVSLMINLVDELKGVPKFQVGCRLRPKKPSVAWQTDMKKANQSHQHLTIYRLLLTAYCCSI